MFSKKVIIWIVAIVAATILTTATATKAEAAPTCMSDMQSLTMMKNVSSTFINSLDMVEYDAYGAAQRYVTRGINRLTYSAIPCDSNLRRTRAYMISTGLNMRVAISLYSRGAYSTANTRLRIAMNYLAKAKSAMNAYSRGW